jgi:hypothetical protein
VRAVLGADLARRPETRQLSTASFLEAIRFEERVPDEQTVSAKQALDSIRAFEQRTGNDLRLDLGGGVENCVDGGGA